MSTATEYTLCFLTHGEQVLLLNRMKAPWMGSWNGVGGKLDKEKAETPLQCARREVEEETGYTPQTYAVQATGRMLWTEHGRLLGSLHLFWMVLHEAPAFAKYPEDTREGILAFRPLSWITAAANTGVVSNLKTIIPALQAATGTLEFVCDYDEAGNMIRMTQTEVA